MARVTVEDCLQNVDNLFQLVLLASQRARRLANGAEPTVTMENDKLTVVALREIAAGNITPEMLREPEPRPESMFPKPTLNRPSALPNSGWWTASSRDLRARARAEAVDYASSLLGLLPGAKRGTPGVQASC